MSLITLGVKIAFFQRLGDPEWYTSTGFTRYKPFFDDLIAGEFNLGPDARILDIGSSVPEVANQIREQFNLKPENIYCVDRCTKEQLLKNVPRILVPPGHIYGGQNGESSFFDTVTFHGGQAYTKEHRVYSKCLEAMDLVLTMNSVIPNTSSLKRYEAFQTALNSVDNQGWYIFVGGTPINFPFTIFLAFQRNENGGFQLRYCNDLDSKGFFLDETKSDNRELLYHYLLNGIDKNDEVIISYLR